MNIDYIESIYDNYVTIKDSLTVIRRVAKKDISLLPKHTVFKKTKYSKVDQKLQSAGNELANLSVLGLFASFERLLRDEIMDKSSKLREIIPEELGLRITALAQKEIERWKISEIIDLFNFAVDGEVRGKLKQILQYRNWIAHGKNPNDLPSVRTTDPKTTYRTISEFVSQIHNFYINSN